MRWRSMESCLRGSRSVFGVRRTTMLLQLPRWGHPCRTPISTLRPSVWIGGNRKQLQHPMRHRHLLHLPQG